jgi:hypothetical protein
MKTELEKRWQQIADRRAIEVADLSYHLRQAIRFLEHTEAFGKMAESGILQAGEDTGTRFNVDAAKAVLANCSVCGDVGDCYSATEHCAASQCGDVE